MNSDSGQAGHFTGRLHKMTMLGTVMMETWRREGTAALVRRCVGRLQRARSGGRAITSAFDAELGTDTDGIVPLWELSLDSPNRFDGVRYQASDPEAVRDAIRLLPIPYRDFTFIDIGSGKGRAVLIASTYPFRAVRGIEFSPELHAIASRNIQRCKGRHRCPDVRSICADAATWPLPEGNLVLFLYNPFGAEVMVRFLHGLKQAIHAENRQVYLIYLNPRHADIIEQTGIFERLDFPAAVYRHPRRSPAS